jgi:hypothetical protein
MLNPDREKVKKLILSSKKLGRLGVIGGQRRSVVGS